MRSKLVCGCLLLLAACGSGGTGVDERQGESSSDLWLSDKGGIWPGGVVDICFKSGSFGPTGRAQIQNALQKVGGWQQAANIIFTGFGICSQANPGVFTVRVERDTTLPANVIGRATDGFKSDRQPYVKFPTDPPPGGDQNILHEFGHVLDFAHETNDNDCNQRTSGGTRLTANDAAFSVMDSNTGCYGSVYGTPLPNVISNNDRLGAMAAYGPWTVACPNGADSTCENVAPVGRADLDLMSSNAPPWWSRMAMNGYGKEFNQKVYFMIHGGYWTVKFAGLQPLELPTYDTHYDFTRFNINNMGCIAFNSTAQQDSIAQMNQGGTFCDVGTSLGFAADGFPRYFSTHYNRDPTLKNAYDDWGSYPNDNQPVIMTATASSGGSAWIDLIQVKVKYGAIDIYSDASTGGNGVIALDKANIGKGTTVLSPPIYGAKKVVFTAHNGHPLQLSTNKAVPAAGLEGVMIGQP